MIIKNHISNKNLVEKYFESKKILERPFIKNASMYTKTELELTRRSGKIVCVEKKHYIWTAKARIKQQIYHLSKNGLEFKDKNNDFIKLILREIDKDNKKKLLEERPFSYFHNKLIENLYNKRSWKEKTITAQAKAAKHEIELENIAKKLKDYKSSLKDRNPKNHLYKIASYFSDGKQHIKLGLKNIVSKEPTCEEIAELNRNLSKNPLYRHTTVRKLGAKTDRFLFVSTNLAA